MRPEEDPRWWTNPAYIDVFHHYRREARYTLKRRGASDCRTCVGLRVIVMRHPNGPFSVPCSLCNPGGV
ncbi:hypothetical protein [Streptomyces clavuligerus]|uniref:Uncharacterized protein n=1 Tax=Streptomyces clavuligerus TaxID=1901 RepID=B5GY43_STRCL|nr:hypothetical protein [Streptomyces clavuligerus]AXU13992.1 hypothetical protein D1794_15375 [Streptomyces clavuligerus]EDY51250.1 hypothetical protein SSCG_04230 [Streptomyces clavuligerus]EFG07828.1 Hypothetical protein SCLAV_2756 [Streptomyces clavuligerus]MBY6303966.1 hypothetical protein [Streptomyces clavuligerus]QCS06765.1 hypothetical protein CRV15_14730 [Streptomyces clavuligerus]